MEIRVISIEILVKINITASIVYVYCTINYCQKPSYMHIIFIAKYPTAFSSSVTNAESTAAADDQIAAIAKWYAG